MEWVVLAATTLITVAITSTFGVFLSRKVSKLIEKKEREEALQEEKNRELDRFRAKQANEELERVIIETINKAMEPIQRDVALIKKGNQANLRLNLNTIADQWLPKGYCPRSVKADFDNIYRNYHAMGENGVMDDIHKKIMKLPETEPKKPTGTTTKRPRKTSIVTVAE